MKSTYRYFADIASSVPLTQSVQVVPKELSVNHVGIPNRDCAHRQGGGKIVFSRNGDELEWMEVYDLGHCSHCYFLNVQLWDGGVECKRDQACYRCHRAQLPHSFFDSLHRLKS